jgi:uncharacterized coiled-coil DUF342 family protein
MTKTVEQLTSERDSLKLQIEEVRKEVGDQLKAKELRAEIRALKKELSDLCML